MVNFDGGAVDKSGRKVYNIIMQIDTIHFLNFLSGFVFGFIGGLQYPHIKTFLKKLW
jgi:hypothetical protein